MLSVEEAKRIGINACIDKIGRDLCREYADNGVSGFGRRDNKVECFVGLNDEHSAPVDPDNITRLVLTHKRDWKYLVECSVDMQDGAIRFF